MCIKLGVEARKVLHKSIDIAGWEQFVQIKGKPYEACQKTLDKKGKLVQEQIKYLRAWLTANKLVKFSTYMDSVGLNAENSPSWRQGCVSHQGRHTLKP